MAISENRVDISSITDTIKSLTTGLTSSKPTQQNARPDSMDLVPQSLTNKSLGIFSDIMCKDFNYSLDLASLFGSLDRFINFGSLELCGNSVTANPFDGSLINGVNSIRSNLLNQFKNLAGIPDSLLGNLNGSLNGILSKYNIPSDCINGFDLSNPYNVNLSGMDRDILGAGGNLCRNRASNLSTAYNMSVLAGTPNALYMYTKELSYTEVLNVMPNIFNNNKDINVNNKINAVTDKFLVNNSTGEDNTLMVSSVLRDDLFTTPDQVLDINMDSSNIISSLDYFYKQNSNDNNSNNGIINTDNNNVNNGNVDTVFDVNGINSSNDTQFSNNASNGSYVTHKGYSDNDEIITDNNDENSSIDRIMTLKNFVSESDRFYRIRHLLNLTDKSWNRDEEGNESYHKLMYSTSFDNMTSSMVITKQPQPLLTLDVSNREYLDYEKIYILNNINKAY